MVSFEKISPREKNFITIEGIPRNIKQPERVSQLTNVFAFPKSSLRLMQSTKLRSKIMILNKSGQKATN